MCIINNSINLGALLRKIPRELRENNIEPFVEKNPDPSAEGTVTSQTFFGAFIAVYQGELGNKQYEKLIKIL